MKQIRVLEILEAAAGGTARHLLQIAGHINKERFSISIIISPKRSRKEAEAFMSLKGVDVRIIPMSKGINPLMDIISIIRIYIYMRKGPFDIIHLHSSKAGAIGRIAAWLAGCRNVIYTPHAFAFMGKWRLRRLYLLIERLLARITDTMIFVSEGEYMTAKKEGIYPRGKSHVVYNGVDTAYFQPCDDINHGLVIGMVSRIDLQKGCGFFVKAAELIAKEYKDVAFVIAGDGNEKNRILSMVGEAGLENRFRFLGHADDPRPIYSMIDILVIPSLWEGMPYTLLEGMAMEKAIVASDIPGINEVIKDRESGLLVRTEDVEGLYKTIKELLVDKGLRDKLGKNARKHVSEHFRVEKAIAELEGIYGKLTDLESPS